MPPKKKKRKPRSRARGTAASPAIAQADQAPQTQDKRRERLEARREAKAKAEAQRYRQQRRARIGRIAALLASVVAIVWFLFIRGSIPDAIAGYDIEDFDAFVSESRANQLHTADPVTYNENPPVSGEHSPQAAACGVYGQPLANPNMLHALEHGAVGILYQPDAPANDIKEAESIAEDYDSHIFSAPYEGLEDPFTIVAWAHLMRLDSFDRAAIVEFVDTFREGGDAPESSDCPLGASQPFEPNPTVSPSAPVETPEPEEKQGSDSKGDDKKKKNKG